MRSRSAPSLLGDADSLPDLDVLAKELDAALAELLDAAHVGA
jgi:hypothetical protein